MKDSKILLVDDEQDILNLLKITLSKEGFNNIYLATSGREAIEKCNTTKIDLIVLDVILPDMQGFDVCKKLRDFTDAPILFLTARTSDLDKLSGFAIGQTMVREWIKKLWNIFLTDTTEVQILM